MELHFKPHHHNLTSFGLDSLQELLARSRSLVAPHKGNGLLSHCSLQKCLKSACFEEVVAPDSGQERQKSIPE
jgi:hypothetical protein